MAARGGHATYFLLWGVMKAVDAINTAFTMAGRKALGQPLDGDELAWGMALLRGMVDSWQADGLYVPFVTETVQTVAGSPITIGPGQTINVPRPKFVRDTSYFRSSGADFPIEWVNEREFNGIGVKAVKAALPVYGHYDGALPTASLYFWPAPQDSQLHLVMDAPLPAFADFNVTDYAVDTGYVDAVAYTLAVKACLGLRDVPPDLERQANNAVRKVRLNNARVPRIGLPWPLAGHRGGSLADFMAGF